MQVVHTFSSTANASINCHDNGVGNVSGEQAKIAAIRLGSRTGADQLGFARLSA
jgi:hypothetical protein